MLLTAGPRFPVAELRTPSQWPALLTGFTCSPWDSMAKYISTLLVKVMHLKGGARCRGRHLRKNLSLHASSKTVFSALKLERTTRSMLIRLYTASLSALGIRSQVAGRHMALPQQFS